VSRPVADDRLDPAQLDHDVAQIITLVVRFRRLWEHAVEGGAYLSSSSAGGRGTGFEDSDPVHSAVASPTRRQLRGTARHAARLLAEARCRLEDAEHALETGLLRTDPEVLAEHLEKRRAATQSNSHG
jgi:hypothetical protein